MSPEFFKGYLEEALNEDKTAQEKIRNLEKMCEEWKRHLAINSGN